MEQIGAQQHPVLVPSNNIPRVPTVRKMRRRHEPEPVAPRVEDVGSAARRRFESSAMLTIAPSSPHPGRRRARASQSLSAPHSSTSKWLQLIQRETRVDQLANCLPHRREHLPHPGVEQERLIVFDEEMIELQVQLWDMNGNPIYVAGDFVDLGHGHLLLSLGKCHEIGRRYRGGVRGLRVLRPAHLDRR